MDFKMEDVAAHIKANPEAEGVVDFLKGVQVPVPITTEAVKSYLESNDDGKAYLKSHTDKYTSKALETFKTDTLPGLVKAQYDEEHPPATEDAKRLANIEKELAGEKAARTKAEFKSKALTSMTEKKLPADLVKYMIGDTEEETLANVGTFADVFEKSVTAQVEAKLAEHGREPGGGTITPNNEPVTGRMRYPSMEKVS